MVFVEQTDARIVLDGQQVVFAGRLASMTRSEAAELVVAQGGACTQTPSRRTRYVVVGQDRADPDRPSRELERARRLRQEGHPVEILAESEFFSRCVVGDDDTPQLYTTAQLARVLGVSGSRVRFWANTGLLKPVRAIHRLSYFSFGQVALARRLNELFEAGLPPRKIRETLRRLKDWCDDVGCSIDRLSFEVDGANVQIRSENGELMEPGGQLLFDFCGDDAQDAEVIVHSPFRGAADMLQRALDYEDSGRLEEAERIYRELLHKIGPEPEFCFNLGNILYGLGAMGEAIERFSQAVEFDPDYAEAWNNLGNVYAEIGRATDAIRAYEAALQVAPDYADAHFNLADTLYHEGRTHEAVLHWRAYLKVDPSSEWAERARDRLRRHEQE